MTLSFSMYGQDPLGGRDLSSLKVDALSDNQITAIQQKLKQSGFTIDQVESQAIAKGMSPAEFAKLKDRLNGVSGIVMAKSVKRGNVVSQTTTSNAVKDSATANFNTNIKDKYPVLTSKDISFCSLIKLNLSNKEIANLLQVSHESVITKKYLLKKKLALSPDQDLYQLINTVE
jgi:DNA-binding CsgD family transcriptional regulator